MKTSMKRRRCLAAGLALAFGASAALAQANYPSQPIRFIVPYPAGGATDTLARLVGQKLAQSWGQPVLVENKVGASGLIGNQYVAKAPADGYTVLVGITALIQQQSLMDRLPYDPLKDFAAVTRLAISPSMFAVPLDSPVRTLDEFITLARAHPNKYSYGTYGIGTSAHIQGALLNSQAKLDLLHVPYNGSAPLVTALVGSQLPAAFLDSASARPHLKSLRPLAVTGTQRIPGLPDVPTFKELGYHSFDPYGWLGLLLPAATPAPVVQKLSAEVNRILRMPDVIARIEAMGLQVGGDKPEVFDRLLQTDATTYARIIKAADIRLVQ